MDDLQALQDQVDELDALRACYDDLLQLAPAETDNLRFASAVAAGGSAAAAPADVPALSGTLQLPDVRLGGAPVLLKFVLGRGAAPSLTVLANASRSDADSLQQLASSVAAEAAADGAPCLLTAADRLAAAAAELAAAEAAAEEERQRAGEQQPAAGSQQQQQQAAAAVLARRAVWYHHIYSEAKKRAIVALARELGIGGMCKPGAPGVLLIEGTGADVCEYLSRLRGLRWQAMAVRAEQDLPLGSQQEVEARRSLPRGVRLFAEGELGELAAAARGAGLGDLLAAVLKLPAAPGP